MSMYLLNTHRHKFFIIAFIFILFIGLFFLPKSAELQSGKASFGQVFSPLKRLSYSKTAATFSANQYLIHSINADGTDRQNLNDFPDAPHVQTTWSPNGNKVAYVFIFPGGNADIYSVNSDGTNRVPLADRMDIDERNPSWSVTGKIAFECGDEICVMDEDGSNQIGFPGITRTQPKAPKWSPDGSKIAFTSGGQIWVINADGTNEQQITDISTIDTEPDWSPDGQKLVYQKGSTGIAVINIDGTNETNLTTGSDDRTPAWSNDNTKIAFVRRGTILDGIYLMDIDGGNKYRLLGDDQGTRPIQHFDPAWRPVELLPNTFTISGRITRQNEILTDVTINLSGTSNAETTVDEIGNYQFSNLPVGGNYLLTPSLNKITFNPKNRQFNNLSDDKIADFAANQTCPTPPCVTNGKIAFSGNGISTANPDGSGGEFLGDGRKPSYSYDGKKIVFASDRDGNYEIYEMNADGSSVVRLTNNSFEDDDPTYSPDGQSIVFTSNRDGNIDLFKINSDGTNEIRLTNAPELDLSPVYSPDGSKILFRRTNGGPLYSLYTMNPDGSNLTAFPLPARFYGSPTYSPDGSKIIVPAGGDVTMQSLHTVNSDGSEYSPLTSGLNQAAYSPDGTKIVLQAFFFGIPRLFIANADGTDRVEIPSTTSGEFPVWQPVFAPQKTKFDFDGDSRADVSVFRPSDGNWHLLNSQDGYSALQFGIADDDLVPSDYDGDLKTDVAVWRSSEGNFYILNSSDGTVRIKNFGLSGDIPTVGDWDNDGNADLSVYRGGTQSVFYYLASSNNPNENITSIPMGISEDKPVNGDFDGDGKMDAAVFRPSNGVWYIRKSSDGQLLAFQFGLADDRQVPADYDGDQKTDVAVYRNGVWYILRSSDGGVDIVQFGVSTDIPTPADYDGDGKADVSVYRDGIWYILQTSNGNANILQFGLAADKPLPASFIQ